MIDWCTPAAPAVSVIEGAESKTWPTSRSSKKGPPGISPYKVTVAYAGISVEPYFRDAPLMIVGEGTNEIQRNVIAAQLVSRGGI